MAGGSMTGWWSEDPNESYWVEIRWATGIGVQLRCPQVDTSGRANPWYDLVLATRPGDMVYHWNAREHRFVGRSIVDGVSRIDDIGDRVVPLKGFEVIRTPVSLEDLRAQSASLLAVRDRLMVEHRGVPLYLPFQYRTDGIRMMSNYFAKLPAAVVSTLFGHSGTADDGLPPPDPVEGGDGQPSIDFSGSFMSPFKPKADTNYVVNIQGGPRRHGRKHETLVNRFAEWLTDRGLRPGKNAAVDIGLENPPVVIEAKILGIRPAGAIRQAVGQLYEYRYFKVSDPDSDLLLLVDRSLEDSWLRYLEIDRGIGVVWPEPKGWHLSKLAMRILGG
jgi:hypothetical protein